MHHIIDVLYDRTDDEEMARAYACFGKLIDEFEKHGYGVYRVNNAFMDRVAETYGQVQRNVNRVLKRALDPNGSSPRVNPGSISGERIRARKVAMRVRRMW
jgi:4-cresol dehydrogenase (hydroxylating)